MRIATLQFAPKLGETSANIDRANTLLSSSLTSLVKIDLLVLPELALSGYNFPSLAAILPYLEPTCSGPSTAWAKATAARFKCIVSIGYPELCTTSDLSGVSTNRGDGVTAYNSTVTVSPGGQILAHYRKTHLYYTDEIWAKEGPEGFITTTLDFPSRTTVSPVEEVTRKQPQPQEKKRVAWGICMDINPRKFTAPWDKYEFTSAAIASDADMVVISTAWLTSLTGESLAADPLLPDMMTFAYWTERLEPLIQSLEKEVLVVLANRCGEEPGGTDHAGREGVRYAGSSWVGQCGHGKINVWKMLGRAEEGVLIADLKNASPEYTFTMAPRDREEDLDNGQDAGEEELETG